MGSVSFWLAKGPRGVCQALALTGQPLALCPPTPTPCIGSVCSWRLSLAGLLPEPWGSCPTEQELRRSHVLVEPFLLQRLRESGNPALGPGTYAVTTSGLLSSL